MLVGYARTSTVEQGAGLSAQDRDLRAYGCEEVFAERVSSVAPARPELARLMSFVRKGDTLAITKIDRLARSVADLLRLIEQLDAKGVNLVILSMGGGVVDTASATGRLMLTMLGAVGEFERALMLERQREGIAKAAAEGKYKGRAPTARRQADEVLRLHADGLGASAIAVRLGIARASVYRIITHQTDERSPRQVHIWLSLMRRGTTQSEIMAKTSLKEPVTRANTWDTAARYGFDVHEEPTEDGGDLRLWATPIADRAVG